MNETIMPAETSVISIAILPFDDLAKSGDSSLFCKSFTNDLIVDFSYFRQYNIISGPTADLIRQNESIDYRILEESGVDYYLLGSFHRIDDTVRINAQLYHFPSNRLVWANRFEKEFKQIISVQASIVEEISAALQTHVTADISRQIRKREHITIGAYELFIKGLEEIKKASRESDLRARDFFRKALEMDPHFSNAYSGMSLTYFNEWSCQVWNKWDISKSEAFLWAKKSIEQDEQNYFAALVIGRVLLYERSFESAEYFLNKSLSLNNNDPETLSEIASCFIFLNKPEISEQLIQKAIRLNKAFADKYYPAAALIYFELDKLETARSYAQKIIDFHWVDGNAHLAALYYFLGDYDEMHKRWKLYLEAFGKKIKNGSPFTESEAINWVMEINPFKGEAKIHEFLRFIGDSHLPMKDMQADEVSAVPDNMASITKLGQEWEFLYNKVNIRLPEVKGFNDLAVLLRNPEKEYHCKHLMGSILEEKGVELADEKARSNYQKRIREIQKELEEADFQYDTERVKKLHEEYDQLIDHLSKIFDVHGRVRRNKDSDDKIRSAVTWRIRSAISKIEKEHPALGKHLSNSVKTGTYCCYMPEFTITWQ